MARRKRTDGPTRAQHEDALRRRARLPEGLQAFAGDADTPEQLAEWINRSLATAARFKASGGRYNAPQFIRRVLHDLVIFKLTRPGLREAAERGITDLSEMLRICEPVKPPAADADSFTPNTRVSADVESASHPALITIQQLAVMLHRSNSTLHKYTKHWPPPAVRGIGRRPHQWDYHVIRSTLIEQFPDEKIPETMP